MKTLGVIVGVVLSIVLYYLCAFYGKLFNPYVMFDFSVPVFLIIIAIVIDAIRRSFRYTMFSVSVLVGAWLGFTMMQLLLS